VPTNQSVVVRPTPRPPSWRGRQVKHPIWLSQKVSKQGRGARSPRRICKGNTPPPRGAFAGVSGLYSPLEGRAPERAVLEKSGRDAILGRAVMGYRSPRANLVRSSLVARLEKGCNFIHFPIQFGAQRIFHRCGDPGISKGVARAGGSNFASTEGFYPFRFNGILTGAGSERFGLPRGLFIGAKLQGGLSAPSIKRDAWDVFSYMPFEEQIQPPDALAAA